jgi:hypothetical protein
MLIACTIQSIINTLKNIKQYQTLNKTLNLFDFQLKFDRFGMQYDISKYYHTQVIDIVSIIRLV